MSQDKQNQATTDTRPDGPFSPLRIVTRGRISHVQYPDSEGMPSNVMTEGGEVIYVDYRKGGKLHRTTGPAVIDTKKDVELYAVEGESLGTGRDGLRRLNALRVLSLNEEPLPLSADDLDDLLSRVADDVSLEERELAAQGRLQEIEQDLGPADAERAGQTLRLEAVRSAGKRNPWALYASTLLIKGAIVVSGLTLAFSASDAFAFGRGSSHSSSHSSISSHMMNPIHPLSPLKGHASSRPGRECTPEEMAKLKAEAGVGKTFYFVTNVIDITKEGGPEKKALKIQPFTVFQESDDSVICRGDGAYYEAPSLTVAKEAMERSSRHPLQVANPAPLREISAEELSQGIDDQNLTHGVAALVFIVGSIAIGWGLAKAVEVYDYGFRRTFFES